RDDARARKEVDADDPRRQDVRAEKRVELGTRRAPGGLLQRRLRDVVALQLFGDPLRLVEDVLLGAGGRVLPSDQDAADERQGDGDAGPDREAEKEPRRLLGEDGRERLGGRRNSGVAAVPPRPESPRRRGKTR